MDICKICKLLYSNYPGKVNSTSISLNNLTNQQELYNCIWSIFLYGIQFFKNNKHSEKYINVNILDVSIKHFEKVKLYMKSLGLDVTLIEIDRNTMKKRLKQEIKMYNYANDRNLKVFYKNKIDHLDLRISSIQSQKDNDAIHAIFKKIDYLEYIININKPKTNIQSCTFEKIINYVYKKYIIRFTFCYN